MVHLPREDSSIAPQSTARNWTDICSYVFRAFILSAAGGTLARRTARHGGVSARVAFVGALVLVLVVSSGGGAAAELVRRGGDGTEGNNAKVPIWRRVVRLCRYC